jgi:hypothetical protein
VVSTRTLSIHLDGARDLNHTPTQEGKTAIAHESGSLDGKQAPAE